MDLSNKPTSRIVFFDGVCGVCNKSVDFLLRVDRKAILRFSPLQGEHAHSTLPAERTLNLDTIVYLDGPALYVRSSAILRILYDVGGFWKVFYPLVFVPVSWRDWLYLALARNRYEWFGKKESCRVPTPEERSQFLD